MAKVAPEDPFAGLADPARLAKDIPDLDLLDPDLPSVATLEERAKRAEGAGLAVAGVTKSGGASASAGIGGMVLVTSGGFRGAYLNSGQSVSMTAIAGEGTAMERDYDYSSALHGADLEPAEKVGRTAGERTVERLNPRKVETRRVPVVFDRRVAGSLVGHLASAINGAAVARKTSFLKDKLGERLFRPGIDVLDDPLRKRGLRSRPFDAEGVATARLAVIEDGVLMSWFLDSATARELSLGDHRPRPARRVVGAVAGPEQPSSRGRHGHAGCVDRRHRRRLLCHRPDRHGRQSGHRRLQPRRLRLLDRERQAQLSRERGHHRRQPDRHVPRAYARERSRVPLRHQCTDRARGGPHRCRPVISFDRAAVRDRLAGAVREAGALALKTFRGEIKSWTKGASSPVSEADLAVDALLRERLLGAFTTPAGCRRRPKTIRRGCGVPTSGSSTRSTAPAPISPAFRTGSCRRRWSARAVRRVAALYAPVTDELFLAVAGGGATVNGTPIAASAGDALAGARFSGAKRRLETLAAVEPRIETMPRVPSLALRLARVAHRRARWHDCRAQQP